MTKLCRAGLLLSAVYFLSGCGPQGGDGNSVQCGQTLNAAVSAQQDSRSVHPASLDSRYRRFLVQRKTGHRELQPSGEAKREYSVKSLTVSMTGLSDGWEALEVTSGDPATLIQELMSDESVIAVEPDFTISTDAIEESAITEAATSTQWAHSRVKTSSAWRISRGSDRVIVAVIDGGVDTHHSALKNNLYRNTREVINGRDDDGNGYVDDINGWDFVGKDKDPRSDKSSHFHGTHVAGIVGAITSARTIGFAPQVAIMPLRFINSNGAGNSSDAIRAIDYAIRMKAHIINASWSSTNYSKAMYAAITRAQKAGILFVTASGNNGLNIDRKAYYPAAYPHDNIVSVGASNGSDKLASFSDYGSKNVDLVAPGTSIYSTKNLGAYGLMSGTSMATPLVSGIAVLVKARHQSFNYKQVARSLFLGVDKFSGLTGKVKYGGRINALKALNAADDVARGNAVPISEEFDATTTCPGA